MRSPAETRVCAPACRPSPFSAGFSVGVSTGLPPGSPLHSLLPLEVASISPSKRQVEVAFATSARGISRISPNKRRAKSRFAARAIEVVARVSPRCARWQCLKGTVETTYASIDNPSGRGAAVTAPAWPIPRWRNRHAEGYERPLDRQRGGGRRVHRPRPPRPQRILIGNLWPTESGEWYPGVALYDEHGSERVCVLRV